MKNSGSEAFRKSGSEASQGAGTDKIVIFLEKPDILGGQSVDRPPLGVFYRFLGDFFPKNCVLGNLGEKIGPEASQGPGTDRFVIFLEKTDIFGGQSIDGPPLGVFYRFLGDFFRKTAFWPIWAKKHLPGTDH